jgi:hypothetical protein
MCISPCQRQKIHDLRIDWESTLAVTFTTRIEIVLSQSPCSSTAVAVESQFLSKSVAVPLDLCSLHADRIIYSDTTIAWIRYQQQSITHSTGSKIRQDQIVLYR